jgi:hypothetical protein
MCSSTTLWAAGGNNERTLDLSNPFAHPLHQRQNELLRCRNRSQIPLPTIGLNDLQLIPNKRVRPFWGVLGGKHVASKLQPYTSVYHPSRVHKEEPLIYIISRYPSLSRQTSSGWSGFKSAMRFLRGKSRGVFSSASAIALILFALPTLGLQVPASLQLPTGTQQTATAQTSQSAQQLPAAQPIASNPAATTPKTEAKPCDGSASTDPNAEPCQQKKDMKNVDRIFGVIPNYLTVEGAPNAPPITPKQKFGLAFDGIRDPYAFFIAGAISGVSQARNETPSWGQGWVAYTKRYWAQLADQDTGPIMSVGLFPTIFHEDPRYYQLGKGSFIHRFNYSLSRLFVTRTDSGHKQFNYSEFVGNAAAAGISNFYYPKEERGLEHNMGEFGMQIAIDLLGNEVKEFWPDIRRKLSRKK